MAARRRPPRTPQAEEDYLISLATEQARKQLEKGTASSQVLTHFLKLGTERERLEREKLQRENTLLEEKAKSYQREEMTNEKYQEVINAMKLYSGEKTEEES